MNIVTISFDKRDFKIDLWRYGIAQSTQRSDNAAKNLVRCLDSVLQRDGLSLDDISKIAFLAGPGSFTSSRILAATCAGIKAAKPHILIVPVELSKAVRAIPGYEKTRIFLKANNFVWQVNCGSGWEIVPNDVLGDFYNDDCAGPDIFPGATKPWPDISEGLVAIAESCSEQAAIMPYY